MAYKSQIQQAVEDLEAKIAAKRAETQALEAACDALRRAAADFLNRKATKGETP